MYHMFNNHEEEEDDIQFQIFSLFESKYLKDKNIKSLIELSSHRKINFITINHISSY